MATSIQATFAIVPALAILIIIGIVLLVIGRSRKDRTIEGYGETILGLTIFALPMAFFLDKVSDDWDAFVPSIGDIVLLGTMSFVGGMSAALGLRNILQRKAVEQHPIE